MCQLNMNEVYIRFCPNIQNVQYITIHFTPSTLKADQSKLFTFLTATLIEFTYVPTYLVTLWQLHTYVPTYVGHPREDFLGVRV